MTPEEEPAGTAAGYCRRCGTWGSANRIVTEIHSDSGAGATVVECPALCKHPTLRRPATEPRTWSL